MAIGVVAHAQRTVKPVLHGGTGSPSRQPLGATAGATIFNKGGNASTPRAQCWRDVNDVGHPGWGGETQALIYNPKTKKLSDQRTWRGRDGRDTCLLQEQGHGLPTRIRTTGRCHPGTPGG